MHSFLHPRTSLRVTHAALLLLVLSACSTFRTPADDRFPLLQQSRNLLESGDLRKAQTLTQQIIARYGPSPFLLNQMALIDNRQGQGEKTLRILRYGHRLFPGSETLTLNLAKEYLAQRDPLSARNTLLPLLDQKSWPNGFRTLMGRVDLDTGHLPEAHLFLHEALARHPDNPLLLATLGLLHQRLGLRKRARTDFQHALVRAPHGPLRRRLKTLLAHR